MLKMTDLTVSKELERKEMHEVRGGFDPFAILASTSISNKVADVDQIFGFKLAQGNAGEVTNNQAIGGGNGVIYAPVDQTQSQYNDMYLDHIGNTTVGGGFSK
ncbi:hypothetical protein [Parahaliea mediterranea]|uniref:Bacteriocin n=1 Tax=Parahaliea mediterranea TaxID=651086 RepID=A0A939DB48_9GAMM|nr:hypothetical protein [Parahaliea mediterranea]MBN7795013.1 hypothetical protein [Parahaliea mediterranea]